MAETLALQYALNEAEAQKRAAEQVSLGSVAQRAADLFPETFAGAWMDHPAGGVLVLAVTEGVMGAEQALRDGFDVPDNVALVQREHSRADLDAEHARLIELLDQSDLDQQVRYAERVDRANALRIGVAPEALLQVRALVSTWAIPVPIEILAEAASSGEGNCFEPTSGDPSRDICPSPLRGGITVANRNRSNRNCTMAYNATNPRGEQYILTAGHCYTAGEVSGHWVNDIGYSASSINDGSVDATRILRNNAYWSSSRWILDSSSDAFQIRGTARADEYVELMVICGSGRRVYKDCGDITSTNSSGGSNTHQIRYYGCGRASDSGRPAYDDTRQGQATDGRAVGIDQSFSNVAGTVDSCTGFDYSHSSKIANVQTRLEVTVRTS